MQMADYSLVEESKCWLLKSYLIFISLLLHWKEKSNNKTNYWKFKYHDKNITHFFYKKKTEQTSQIPKTIEPPNSCSSQANAHNTFTSDLLP